jgi:hypothetical protein
MVLPCPYNSRAGHAAPSNYRVYCPHYSSYPGGVTGGGGQVKTEVIKEGWHGWRER